MIVELNREVLLKRFLPELAQRYFAGADSLLYDVAVVDGANPPQFLYSSKAHPSPDLVGSPDEALHLFSSRRGRGFETRQGNLREPGDTARRERISPPPPPFRGADATLPRAHETSWPRRSSRTLPPPDGDWWCAIRAVPWRKRWP